MTRRKYTKEFKEEAVRLTYTSNKGIQQIAVDLGLNAGMLGRWRHEYQERRDGTVAFPGSGHARDEELMNLRKALKQAEMERDILKKTIAFFAQQPK